MSEAHTISMRAYVAVFCALLVLTAVTVAVAFVDLGEDRRTTRQSISAAYKPGDSRPQLTQPSISRVSPSAAVDVKADGLVAGFG